MPDSGMSRRQWIELLGAGGVMSVAGCSGDGGTPTATESSSPTATDEAGMTDEPTDSPGNTATATATETQGPPLDTQLDYDGVNDDYTNTNFQVGTSTPKGPVPPYVYDPPFRYYPTSDKIEPQLLRNFREEGDWAVFDVVEGSTWHNGDEITAEDIAFNYNFNIWLGSGNFLSFHNGSDDVAEAVDSTTVRIYRRGKDQKGNTYRTNPTIWKLQASGVSGAFSIEWHPDHWQWALDRAKEVQDQPGDVPENNVGNLGELRSSLVDPNNEVSTDKYEWADDAGPRNASDTNWPMGSGLWKLNPEGAVAADFIDLKLHEGHYLADEIDIETLRLNKVTAQTAQANVANDTVDFTNARGGLTQRYFRARDSGSIKDHWHYIDKPTYGGNLVMFNANGKTPIKSRDVRAAIMHVVDREKAVQNLPSVSPIDVPVELSSAGGTLDFWFDQDIQDQFISYDNSDRGATLLRRQGFERRNGTWTLTEDKPEWGMSSGDPLEFNFSVTNGNVPSTIGSSFASDLQKFGIKPVYKEVGGGTFWSAIPGDKEMMVGVGWNNGFNPWPAYGRLGATVSKDGGSAGWAWGFALNTKIPEFGQPDGEPTKDFNIRTYKDTMFLQAGSLDEAREIAKTMCWYQNWAVPEIPITESVNQFLMSVDHWNIEGFDPDPGTFKIEQQNTPQIWGTQDPKKHMLWSGLLNAKHE